MTHAELQRALSPAGALLVEPRILRRVIRRHRRLSGLALAVLHGHCYTLPRDELLKLVDPTELPPGDLPDDPILVPFPEDEPVDLIAFWRRVFHARVHQALAQRARAGALTAARIREHVHRIGQAEFDEIRYVLRQEELLLPPRDELETYCEFAAFYLELRTFDPAALARTFPTLLDPGEVDAVLAKDVDVVALLAASRPDGAPARPARPSTAGVAPAVAASPAEDAPLSAADADRARASGNLVRSALARARAGDTGGARQDLDALAARLVAALGHGDAAAWSAALAPLLSAERFAVEGRLLYDLQKAITDHEREPRKVDLAAFLFSFGRRPLVRPLLASKEVRIARHLHAAEAKLAKVRLAETDRAPLAALLHHAAAEADDRVRAMLSPVLERALDDVRLVPHTIPERVARRKLVAELLDQVVAHGFLTLGHLRDAVSRNQLKLADVTPRELIRGDALLRLDRRFAAEIDGVYRRGEIYLRFLQKLSSLFFGTRPGRFLTLYAILPLLGSFVVLEGLQHMVGPVVHALGGAEPTIYTQPAWIALAAVLFVFLHSAGARRAGARAARAVGRALRAVFVDAPLAVWRLPLVQRVARSRPVVFVLRHVVRPGVPAAAVALAVRRRQDLETTLLAFGVAYFVIGGFLTSRAGAAFQEHAADWARLAGRNVGTRLIPGLIRLVLDVFKSMLELLDRFLYIVDEWLRFRSGERRLALAAKAILGSIWGVLRYLIRIYVNLLIEPTVNPIKHFPVVTVAGKIMAPFYPTLVNAIGTPLLPLGTAVARTFGTANVLFAPGLAGFLVWELKENWRLYGANRPRELRAVIIGGHGETMGRFLRPGLHSGTVPKTYGKLRRAAWRGDPSQAKHRETLHHVEDDIRHFVEREIIALLEEAAGWRLSVGRIHIASNRVRIEIRAPDGAPAWLAFEEQSGWILAGFAEPGFVATLDPERQRVLDNALAGLYKLAAVDMVREQIALCLPSPSPYDISDEGLVVWPDGDFGREIVYDLRVDGTAFVAHDGAAPPIPAERLLFARQPVAWVAWVDAWRDGASRLADSLTPRGET